MEKRYRALRFVASLWKVLAWVILALGLLGSVGILVMSFLGVSGNVLRQASGLVTSGIWGGILAFLGGVLVTLIQFVIFYAVGESISLGLAIEENTRVMATWVQLQPQSAPVPVGTRSYTLAVIDTPPPPGQ